MRNNIIFKKSVALLFFIHIGLFGIAQNIRGRVDESEWRDPDEPEPSIFSYIITIAIIFGIPWLISEIIKIRNKNK
jgi:hypothetical protein